MRISVVKFQRETKQISDGVPDESRLVWSGVVAGVVIKPGALLDLNLIGMARPACFSLTEVTDTSSSSSSLTSGTPFPDVLIKDVDASYIQFKVPVMSQQPASATSVDLTNVVFLSLLCHWLSAASIDKNYNSFNDERRTLTSNKLFLLTRKHLFVIVDH